MSPPIIPGVPGPVAPIVELGIGDRYDASAVAGLWGSARWSTVGPENEWGGAEPLWNDITCEALDISTFSGRDGSLDPFEIGTATIVLRNLNGWADYKPTPGPEDNVLTVRPGRQIRAGVAIGLGSYESGTPQVDGYLTPTVGTVTTPDPGPLPAQCVFVFKVRGPTGGAGNQTIVGKQTATPSLGWFARRSSVTGEYLFNASTNGTTAGSTRLLTPPVAVTPTTAEEMAIAYAFTGTQLTFTLWKRTAGVWQALTPTTTVSQTAVFSPAIPLRIGAYGSAGVTEVWNGRIYSVELRTGLDPTAGSVMWRFDANDYPGTGTVYTDPRGRTWTLTAAAAITPKVPEIPPVLVPPAPQWLWRGVVDIVEPGYVPGEGDTVTMGCIDAKGDAGRVEMPKTLAPVGAGEVGSRRAKRILDNVKWPAARRNLELDSVDLGPTELGTRASAELDRTAESSSGAVYGDTAGKVHYRRKDWMVWASSAPVDATIGNGSSSDVCPSGWEVRFARDDITTRAIAGRANETPVVLDRSEDSGLYGLETWERTDLLPVDNFELNRIASRVLNVRSPKHMPRIAAVTLDASTGAGEVAELLATASPFTPSRYRVRHYGTGGRLVFDRTMLVTGVRHTISPRDGWTARLALDDALPFRTVANPARWSDAATKWSDVAQWTNAR